MSRVVYLKELIEIKNGKDYRKLEKGKIPVYGTGGVIAYVNDFLYDGESILLPRKGSLNNIMYVDNDKFWTVDTMYWSVVKKEKVYPKYLFCYLSLLNLSSRDTGSTLPSMTFDSYYTLPIKLYDYEIQKKIGDLYFKLTQKIELNNKINSELEAMAKTIYDYWFLQFEFPNEEGKPYKSSGGKMVWNDEVKREIPEGWEVKSIFDELSVQYGFPFATDKFTDGKTDIPVVRIRDILTNTISTYSNENVDEKYRLNEQDLLIGMDGNFHMNYWIDNTSYLNQRSVRLRTKDTSNVSIIQVKYNIAPYIKAKEERAGGSTVGHLSDKDLKELKILVPKTKKLREILDNTLMKIVKNRRENQELTSLRDFLLPLLMNGQVGFKEK